MDYSEFETLIKFALSNLYDFAALETHPQLTGFFPPPQDFTGNKGDYLRKYFLQQIETLKPGEIPYDINASEWRGYIILTKRYLNSQPALDVANQLAISERQLRRYTRKAINTLSLILWEKLSLSNFEVNEPTNPQEFSINREEINLHEIITGVIGLLSSRINEEQIEVHFQKQNNAVIVKSDRIILRQILIGLVNDLLQAHVNDIHFACEIINDQPNLQISSNSFNGKLGLLDSQQTVQENSIHYWVEQLGIHIKEDFDPASTHTNISLNFPTTLQKTILIVDDQEPALRMFTRYLSRTNFKIIGLRKPTKVLEKANELQPVLILLDIMMPKVDGWELFQSLKLDENTKHIPVIICSAWGEPELAKSLGATAFLRKPVTQRDLLSTIQSLGIIE
ncbi:MAG: response regulator [Anaerolineaceae bacterium]|nr:response regulator [Anaerolineaceae bacterium]